MQGKGKEKEFKALPDEKMTFTKFRQWAELGCIVSNLIQVDKGFCHDCPFHGVYELSGKCLIFGDLEWGALSKPDLGSYKQHPDCMRLIGDGE